VLKTFPLNFLWIQIQNKKSAKAKISRKDAQKLKFLPSTLLFEFVSFFCPSDFMRKKQFDVSKGNFKIFDHLSETVGKVQTGIKEF
jgi:hypothetical protein